MVKHVFCVKDEIVGFMSPIIETNSDVAIRNFKYSMMRLLVDEDSACPVDDYNLYEIGTFNMDNGELISCEPKLIYTGVRVIKEYNAINIKKEGAENE